METNCPSCGKKLTIPDQYAGRMMRCPLCNGTFTAPPSPGSSQMGDGKGGNPGTGTAHGTPPSFPTKPTTDFSVPLPEPGKPPPPPPPRNEPVRRFSIVLHPRVIQWIVPGCLWLIFILSFLTWISYGPGGMPLATQSGWQAAFGLEPWLDPDIGSEAPFVKKDGDRKTVDLIPASMPLLFYLLLIVPLTVMSLLAVVLTAFPNLAPPAVRPVVPWRWLITTGLTLLTLLLLGLQMLAGFGLESKVADTAETRIRGDMQAAKDEPTRKTLLLRQAEEVANVRRSFVPRLVLVLHIIALLCCVVMWWLDSRPTQPLPRIDVLW